MEGLCFCSDDDAADKTDLEGEALLVCCCEVDAGYDAVVYRDVSSAPTGDGAEVDEEDGRFSCGFSP